MRSRTVLCGLTVIVVATIMLPGMASASVIFDDDFPGDKLDTTTNWTVTYGAPTVSGFILTLPIPKRLLSVSRLLTSEQSLPLRLRPPGRIAPVLAWIAAEACMRLCQTSLLVMHPGSSGLTVVPIRAVT